MIHALINCVFTVTEFIITSVHHRILSITATTTREAILVLQHAQNIFRGQRTLTVLAQLLHKNYYSSCTVPYVSHHTSDTGIIERNLIKISNNTKQRRSVGTSRNLEYCRYGEQKRTVTWIVSYPDPHSQLRIFFFLFFFCLH